MAAPRPLLLLANGCAPATTSLRYGRATTSQPELTRRSPARRGCRCRNAAANARDGDDRIGWRRRAWYGGAAVGSSGRGADGRRLEADRPGGVLVGGTLYFVCQSGALLRYGFLGKQSLSLIKPPPGKFHGRGTIVTRAENGGLGLATLGRDVLHLWSTETGFRGGVKWVKMNDIHLQKLMPFKSPARLIGSTEDTNVVFVTSDDHGIFTIELKSLLMKKVCEMGEVDDVFPYVCFYTPAGIASCTSSSLFG
ncbi:hypothetical protein TRIUR3_16995 [Triticum urartu]|uniref:Uncharacterized protein n=1 Tax=Triticum urartu TaxID=4572 RepID=M7ZWL7_TRIUA|nr:hypothetical protein TRIUR3_16995 [Triticum urartu]